MTRVSWLTTLVLGAAFVFLFVSTREGSGGTMLLGNYNNPNSPHHAAFKRASS